MAKKLEKPTLAEMIAVESAAYVNGLWEEHQNATSVYRGRLQSWYKQYRGIPSRTSYSGNANVFVNETLSAAESIVAQEFNTYYSEPKRLRVFGREATDQPRAQVIEELTHYYLDCMGDKQKVLRQIRQKNKYGTTAAKICWTYEAREVTQRDPESGETVTKKIPITDRPDLEYIDLLDLACDPGKPDVDAMDWVVIRKYVTIDDIKKRERDGLYSAAQVAKMEIAQGKGKGGYEFLYGKQQRLQASGINYADFREGKLEILEFWGKMPKYWVDENVKPEDPEASDMVMTVCEVVKAGPTLRLERNPYWHQEIPILIGHYIQVDDEFYGIGVCEIAEYLQQELNDKRNQLLDHATFQIFPQKMVSRQASIDMALMNQNPDQKIPCDGDARAAVANLQIGGNPTENVMMEERCKQDIRSNTGATSPVQGLQSNKESTAFEVNELMQRGASRINVAAVDFGEKFLKRMYRLMYKMVQQYTTVEKAVRIIGKDGIRFEKVTIEDLIHDYDFVPRIATDIDSRTLVRNQLIQFVTGIAPMYPRINIYMLVRKIYALFGYEDTDEIVPLPDTEKNQNQLDLTEEIQVLSMGQKMEVQFWEDHLTKLETLGGFYRANQGKMKPEARAAFEDKIRQHMGYLQTLEGLMQQQSMTAGAGPAAPEGGPGRTPAKPAPNGAVNRSAQMKRDLTRAA